MQTVVVLIEFYVGLGLSFVVVWLIVVAPRRAWRKFRRWRQSKFIC
jgi:hypothetical protein